MKIKDKKESKIKKTKIVNNIKIEFIRKKLNPKQHQFCRLYTKNSYLFGNATMCYAKAYGFDLDSLSEDAIYKEELVNKETGEIKSIKTDDSSYTKAYRVCQVSSARLLSNDIINQCILELLNESMTDTEVDAEIVWIMRQRIDLSPKIQAIKEYNKMKGRVIDKREVEIKGLSLKKLYDIAIEGDDE